jgi:citrate synthase
MPRYLTAEEAADELDVTKNTLYAYVSRGLVRSEPADTSRRTRRYRADDVRRLKRKNEHKQDPATAAQTALDWGLPVMESALTLIEEGRFYSRGHDACRLAQTHMLEEVAPLLWNTPAARIDLASADLPVDPMSVSDRDSTLDRMQALLPRAAASDDRAYDLSEHGVARTGTRLLALLAALVEAPSEPETARPLAERLRRAWGVEAEDARELLNTALVLCADHGLNVTAFAVRCVASAGTTPYGAVNAGLSALRGRRHTGNAARIQALLREAGSPDAFRDTVAQRLRRGDVVPGFGHRLYPDGDPRAALILERLRAVVPEAEGTAFAMAAAEVGPDLLDRPPGLDFALVALARALDLPREAPLTLFALGRTVGWTGHMIEQYEAEQVIRPRAQYVGPPPDAA